MALPFLCAVCNDDVPCALPFMTTHHNSPMTKRAANHGADRIIERYRKLRAWAGGDAPLAMLDIGSAETWIAVGTAAEPSAVASMAIGERKTIQGVFRQGSATELSVETEIAALEEEIMPLASLIPPGALLCSEDSIVFDLARVSGSALAGQMELQRDALEVVFNRWTRTALSGTAAMDVSDESKSLAAGILILREILHHWSVGSITAVHL